jgi:hypothetical protein
MILAVDSRVTALRGFLVRAADKNLDPQVQAELCKLGAVMTCGTLERCIELIILERLANKAHPRIISFVKGHFKRGANYDCEAIEQLFRRFDPDWAEDFRKFVEANDAVKQSVASCYSVRNAVAHGAPQGLGISTLNQYAAQVVGLIEELEKVTSK